MKPPSYFYQRIAKRLTLVAIAVALPAILIGLFFNATAALSFALMAVVLMWAIDASRVAAFADWVQSMYKDERGLQQAEVPEGAGVWENIIGQLNRVFKRELKARKTLLETVAKFEEASEALPDGAIMLDAQNSIIWANQVAQAHWGIRRDEDRLQNITYLIRQPEFAAYLARERYGEPLILRLNHRDKSGETTEQVLSIQFIPYGTNAEIERAGGASGLLSGEMMGLENAENRVSSGVDITSKQKLILSRDITQIERLENMRRDFVANVSHELRTPLTVMSGFLETLTLRGVDNAEITKKSLAHMSVQALRMRGIVEDLLVLSRLEDRTNPVLEAPVDMAQVIADAIEDAQHLSLSDDLLRTPRHHIEAAITGDWLLASRDEMASAVSNLLNNAVRYSPMGSCIKVTWAMIDGAPMFSVEDNGDGIAPAHLARLTERFYRVDQGRSRDSGGTGLGLAIVKHIALRHGAGLNIESSIKAENHGSKFSIVFPATRRCAAAPQPKLAVG